MLIRLYNTTLDMAPAELAARNRPESLLVVRERALMLVLLGLPKRHHSFESMMSPFETDDSPRGSAKEASSGLLDDCSICSQVE